MSLRANIKKLSQNRWGQAALTNSAIYGFLVSIINDTYYKVILLLLVFTLIPITAYFIGWMNKNTDVPIDVSGVLSPICKHKSYIPAKPTSIVGACRLANMHFAGSSIDQTEIIKMYEISPYSLVTLECDDITVAYADFFVLKEEALEALKNGTLCETEMQASMVLSHDDFCETRSLYLAGIVVKTPNATNGGRRSAMLLWAICQVLLKKFFNGCGPAVFYAEAYSSEGAALLRALQFKIADNAESRKSGNTLYSRTVCEETVKGWLDNQIDWSNLCSIEITEKTSVSRSTSF